MTSYYTGPVWANEKLTVFIELESAIDQSKRGYQGRVGLRNGDGADSAAGVGEGDKLERN